MDYNKIGKLIKKIREEKGWSQEKLADKLFCERTKINKIENGKRYIKLDDLFSISEILEVSIEELISGEKVDNKNKKQIDITFKQYLKAQNTKIKRMRIISIFLLIVALICISIFTITYFFQNYKSIRIYKFYGSSENYEINDGLLILSKDKIYLKIDNIIPEVDDIFIYSEYDQNNKKLIYHGNPKELLNDNYGYDSFISYKDFIDSKQKIFVMINNEKINLTFKEEFVNKKIIYKEQQEIGEENSNNFIIPSKIKDSFACDESSCYLELNNENLIYSNDTFSLMTKNEYYLYDITNSLLEYQNLKNSTNNFTIAINNNEINCISGNCKDAEKIYDKFYNSYILKYLNYSLKGSVPNCHYLFCLM